jgi:hypothetical protein
MQPAQGGVAAEISIDRQESNSGEFAEVALVVRGTPSIPM